MRPYAEQHALRYFLICIRGNPQHYIINSNKTAFTHFRGKCCCNSYWPNIPFTNQLKYTPSTVVTTLLSCYTQITICLKFMHDAYERASINNASYNNHPVQNSSTLFSKDSKAHTIKENNCYLLLVNTGSYKYIKHQFKYR